MRIITNLIRKCYLIAALLLPSCLFGQSASKCFKARLQTPEKKAMNVKLTSSDTIPLKNLGTIYALSIDAVIEQPREASFVRIVLEDVEGKNYLVAESDRFRNDTTTVLFTEYCEETALLSGITPLRLKCYLTNATLQLMGIHASTEMSKRGNPTSSEMRGVKETQVKDIVDRINAYNVRHGKLWRAGMTNMALMNCTDRCKLLGAKIGVNTNCIEYYAGGIFEFGSISGKRKLFSESLYADSFDWSFRHGKNWMTPIRDQRTTPFCTAFSVAAGVETMRNLYYNRPIIEHLSVQEIACCAKYNPKPDSLTGINIDSALIYTRDSGLMLDSIYPFDEQGLQICLSDEKNPDEKIAITGYNSRRWYNFLPDSLLKKELINRGPQICWLYASDGLNGDHGFNHAMLLVGYGQIHSGMKLNFYYPNAPHNSSIITADDPRIGMTYWKFKNSWGLSSNNGYVNGEYDGYMYILMDSLSVIKRSYSIQTPILSEKLSDSDILCEDLDGDGYFNWGIGARPLHCPIWAPEESDGDDSEKTKGHMNQFGFCDELPNSLPLYQYISNDSTILAPEYRASHLGIINRATVIVKEKQTFADGLKLLLDKSTTLILDNTEIDGCSLQPYPDSKIILNNGATILKPFELPLGVELIINNGKIQ